VGAAAPGCLFTYTSIQAAVNGAGLGETIRVDPLVGIVCDGCTSPYLESVTINKHVCLKAEPANFWTPPSPLSPGIDFRYPVVIESSLASQFVIDVTRTGSGSCIQGFKFNHRGAGAGAVRIGLSNSSGPGDHANDVRLVGNLIDVSQSLANPTPGEQPHGVLIAGRNN
jgi:hypothetical protein